MVKKTAWTFGEVLELLEMMYNRSRTERLEDVIEDYIKFWKDPCEDDGGLILAMKEYRQSWMELEIGLM